MLNVRFFTTDLTLHTFDMSLNQNQHFPAPNDDDSSSSDAETLQSSTGESLPTLNEELARYLPLLSHESSGSNGSA